MLVLTEKNQTKQNKKTRKPSGKCGILGGGEVDCINCVVRDYTVHLCIFVRGERVSRIRQRNALIISFRIYVVWSRVLIFFYLISATFLYGLSQPNTVIVLSCFLVLFLGFFFGFFFFDKNVNKFSSIVTTI